MTTIFDEETEEESAARFDQETAEVDGRIEPQGEVISPPQQDEAEEAFPLESLITVELCGLLFSLPGIVRARQTGHEWWKLDDEEKTILGTASQPLVVYLVRRWLGEGVGMYAATAAALAAIYIPRQMREAQEQAEARRRGESARPNGSVPSSAAASPQSSVSEAVASPVSSGGWGIPFRE